jgi:hypothetical protein
MRDLSCSGKQLENERDHSLPSRAYRGSERVELFLHGTFNFWSRYGSFSAVAKLRAMYRVSNSFLCNTQTGSGSHPGSYPRDIRGGFLLRIKEPMQEADRVPPTKAKKKSIELYFHFSTKFIMR